MLEGSGKVKAYQPKIVYLDFAFRDTFSQDPENFGPMCRKMFDFHYHCGIREELYDCDLGKFITPTS